jgi:hypothetical protein
MRMHWCTSWEPCPKDQSKAQSEHRKEKGQRGLLVVVVVVPRSHYSTVSTLAPQLRYDRMQQRQPARPHCCYATLMDRWMDGSTAPSLPSTRLRRFTHVAVPSAQYVLPQAAVLPPPPASCNCKAAARSDRATNQHPATHRLTQRRSYL